MKLVVQNLKASWPSIAKQQAQNDHFPSLVESVSVQAEKLVLENSKFMVQLYGMIQIQ